MYLLNNRFSSPIYIVYFTNQPFSGLIYMLNTKDLVFQQRKCLQYPKININQNSESEPAEHCMHHCSLMKRYFTLSVLTMVNYFTTRAQNRNQANNTVSIAHNCAYSIRNL